MSPSSRLTVATITIARNEERNLPRLFESFRSQTRPADEHVLVDDGSKDATTDLIDEFAASGGVVRVERLPGVGRGAAMNAALSLVEADVAVICDADDRSYPWRLECHSRFFADNPAVDWHAGQADLVDEADRPYGRTHFPVDPGDVAAKLASGNTPVCHAASALRVRLRDTLSPLYCDAVNRAVDLEMFLAHRGRFTIAGSQETLIRYQRNGNDLSLRAWLRHRPRHHFAVRHGALRRSSTALPVYEDWWSELGPVGRVLVTDLPLFAKTQLRHARRFVPRGDDVRS